MFECGALLLLFSTSASAHPERNNLSNVLFLIFLSIFNLDISGIIQIIGHLKNFTDKIPVNARCNFQNGWCGWKNVSGRPLSWILNSGPTPSERTGPSFDHTYRNKTGTYY
jgi:hypothetical protein